MHIGVRQQLNNTYVLIYEPQHKEVKQLTEKIEAETVGRKVSQDKISIPRDEWKLILDYFNTHKAELKIQGIRNPTQLLRHWMLDKYRENIARESKR